MSNISYSGQNNIQEVIAVSNGLFTCSPGFPFLSPLIPTIGWMEIYGLVYAAGNVNVLIKQGIVDDTGFAAYRDTVTTPVGGGTSARFSQALPAKYVQVEIVDASGLGTGGEVFFALRAYA